MDEKVFWHIIGAARKPGQTVEDGAGAIIEQLTQLPPEQIVAFDVLFDRKTDAAYRRDLWDAASLINGGASDDGFYYFRCWLVGMGKEVYENALANPDALADADLGDDDAEAGICSIARRAWEQVTGKEANGEYSDLYNRLKQELDERIGKLEPGLTGEDLTDEMIRARWPKLAARYLSDEDEDE